MPEIVHLAHYKFLLIYFTASLIFGQSHPNEEIDSLLRAGIDNIILHNYSDSEIIFKELDQSYNNIPLGKIYLAATEIAKSVDYEEDINHIYVDSLLSSAENQSDSLLSLDEDSIWYNYYKALTLGYVAYYNSVSGNIISAFADGVLSLHAFQKCLDNWQNFYEAYIAIGTYNYWKSAQSKALLWLPFIPDNRDEGIDLLEKTINSESYNKHLAVHSLIWIYIDYGKSKKAVELSLKMLREYPSSRFFMWGLARAYQDLDRKKAIETYYEILNSIKVIQNRNQYNDIVLMHKIAMLYDEIGENEKALDLCNEILDFEFKSVKIKQKLEDRIDRTETLKQSILEKME